jgi:hypothetical protein
VSVLINVFSASEDFDKLCFDYGLELDEDVGAICQSILEPDRPSIYF